MAADGSARPRGLPGGGALSAFRRGRGAYDSGKAVSLGILYHSFDYTAGEPRYFNCIMESGVIRYSAQELFPLPELANKR
ncbi:MAG: hypothetical protein ACLSG5_16905 [Oscillospiraceae bacterium]